METITDDNIHNLVNEYINGNIRRLPPIGTWDVSGVTNMHRLLKKKI
jgi:hypothetical protein